MKRISIGIAVLLSGCAYNPNIENSQVKKPTFDVADPEVDKIVSESSRPLGNGFYQVHRSMINPPFHWEGIGHFSFIFFGSKKICQCGPNDTAITEKGEFIVYVNQSEDGNLEIFDTRLSKITELWPDYIGYPKQVFFEDGAEEIVVELDDLEGGISRQTFDF